MNLEIPTDIILTIVDEMILMNNIEDLFKLRLVCRQFFDILPIKYILSRIVVVFKIDIDKDTDKDTDKDRLLLNIIKTTKNVKKWSENYNIQQKTINCKEMKVTKVPVNYMNTRKLICDSIFIRNTELVSYPNITFLSLLDVQYMKKTW